MDPRNLSIDAYTYTLPEDKIARYPCPVRDESRLLVYRQGSLKEDHFSHLPDYLNNNTLLVFNNTRVVQARIVFFKPSGAAVELFCLEPQEPGMDLYRALCTTGHVYWHCLVGGASKWKKGQILDKKVLDGSSVIHLQATFIGKRTSDFVIFFSWQPDNLSFADIMHVCGQVPLPPYLKRAAEQEDQMRYQTVYATQDGSVAAPTAGLHFTERVFEQLKQKGVASTFLTLHVGAGTFQPVKSPLMQQHAMHAEHMEVSKSFVECLIKRAKDMIIPVGTTSLRTLESLFWLGAKIFQSGELDPADLRVLQWEPYQQSIPELQATDALECLLYWMQRRGMDRLYAQTELLIAPGYSFKLTDGLITNFHQPRSTLLLLVAALIGDEWKSVYDYALSKDFRFLSYGDSCLLFKSQPVKR